MKSAILILFLLTAFAASKAQIMEAEVLGDEPVGNGDTILEADPIGGYTAPPAVRDNGVSQFRRIGINETNIIRLTNELRELKAKVDILENKVEVLTNKVGQGAAGSSTAPTN